MVSCWLFSPFANADSPNQDQQQIMIIFISTWSTTERLCCFNVCLKFPFTRMTVPSDWGQRQTRGTAYRPQTLAVTLGHNYDHLIITHAKSAAHTHTHTFVPHFFCSMHNDALLLTEQFGACHVQRGSGYCRRLTNASKNLLLSSAFISMTEKQTKKQCKLCVHNPHPTLSPTILTIHT